METIKCYNEFREVQNENTALRAGYGHESVPASETCETTVSFSQAVEAAIRDTIEIYGRRQEIL